MDNTPLLQGKLVRRLFALFIILGVVPIILFTFVPAIYQAQASRVAVSSVSAELEKQAEDDLLQFATANAARYDRIFQDKTRIAVELANYVASVMAEPEAYAAACQWQMDRDTYEEQDGWIVNGPEQTIGFVMSPVAQLQGGDFTQQHALAMVTPILPAIVSANPDVRSTFILLEDQTIWLYPNLFWRNGEFLLPPNEDITTRPYYVRNTREPVWSNPYSNAGMTPIISVAAPVWVDEQFEGVAGISFELDTLVREVLQTEVGEDDFMFLIGTDGQLIVFPRQARAAFLTSLFTDDTDIYLDQKLLDVVTDDVRHQLASLDFQQRMSEGVPFISSVDLPTGPAHLAFVPMPTMPWYVVAVRSASRTSFLASELTMHLENSTQSALRLMIISGTAFLTVVLIGGLVTLRRLALPVQELIKGAQIVGAGDLSHRVRSAGGEDEMTELVLTFNDMVAAVQEMKENVEQQRAALQHALTARENEFEALNQIAVLSNQQSDLPGRLNTALAITRDAVGADVVSLSILDESGKLSFLAMACEESEKKLLDPHVRICLDRGLMQAVVQSKRPIVIPDIYKVQEPMLDNIVTVYEQIGTRMLAMQPVVSKEQVLGVLTLLNRRISDLSDQQSLLLDTLTKHIAVLIENAQLQDQMRTLLIMNERRRLASELHDSVKQSLFSLSFTAEGLKTVFSDADETGLKGIDMLIEQVQTVQAEMRNLINELRPVELQTEGLEAALHRHARSFRRTTGNKVNVMTHGAVAKLPYTVQRNLNRIVQEALSNVARHANATRVEVTLDVHDDIVELVVSDDGCGFDTQEMMIRESSSLGLLSMRERTELLRGVLQIRSTPTEGTMIIARIPLEN